jgi:hypothetical protein
MMSISFLTVTAEESIVCLQNLIVSSFNLKDKILAEYDSILTEQTQVDAKLNDWTQEYSAWLGGALQELQRIYQSPVNAYIVRDEQSIYVKTGIPKVLGGILLSLEVKTKKLNEYLNFILQHIDGKITINGDIILRDKFEVSGERHKIKTTGK